MRMSSSARSIVEPNAFVRSKRLVSRSIARSIPDVLRSARGPLDRGRRVPQKALECRRPLREGPSENRGRRRRPLPVRAGAARCRPRTLRRDGEDERVRAVEASSRPYPRRGRPVPEDLAREPRIVREDASAGSGRSLRRMRPCRGEPRGAGSTTKRTHESAPESREAHRAAHVERSPRPAQRASSASIAASVSPVSRRPVSSAIGIRSPRLAAPPGSEAGDGLLRGCRTSRRPSPASSSRAASSCAAPRRAVSSARPRAATSSGHGRERRVPSSRRSAGPCSRSGAGPSPPRGGATPSS